MNIFAIVPIFLSLVPGILSGIAANVLWREREFLPGSLFPTMFCASNAVYSITFTSLMLINALFPELDSITTGTVWVVMYALQQTMLSLMALFFIGRVSDGRIRRFLKIPPATQPAVLGEIKKGE